ncbi:DnaK family superfamily protein [Acanthamoeba castellanii str. Neff]|uniref:DnaK family superfamily protein n=1 Tax=Acanthamoeba castellanii (strain ATCC 30010 / Neff) TaxID=1257118 RepID=L8H2I0_ACACF|nr:DnaK family superfamily protein [Acanthamoeba castellanii str. Neff]ELR19440.1 DnaK family superfamily protein [Acanthamoeba castellanii str. Neff]
MRNPSKINVLSTVTKGLAIDWGTEWVKMVLVAPTVQGSLRPAVEVVVDEQSERRTPALVAFDPPPAATGRLLVGNAAGRVAGRRPDAVLPALKRLLGGSLDPSAAATSARSYARDFAHHFTPPRALSTDESRRGAAVVEEPLAGRRVRVEEAVARLFEHCRDLAGGPDEVAEVVVTVPPYYTFAQRRLLAQTLRLAGLEPLVLVNDLTAAAIDYASTRQFPSRERTVFFDVGAHAASASVVEFRTVDGQTHIKVLGTDSELDVGGFAWDGRLAGHLAQVFGRDPSSLPPRALSKLLKEAQLAKEELSNAPTAEVDIENLYEGRDLVTVVTHEQLEGLIADLLPRAAAVIGRALAQAGVALSDVSAIELFGGAARGDEAAVLGAATQLILTKDWGRLISPSFPRLVVNDLPPPSGAGGVEVGELDGEALEEVQRGLEEFATREREYQETANWRNTLEASILERKSQLEESEDLQPEEVREEIVELLRSAEEWLEDLPENARAEEVRQKFTELQERLAELTAQTTTNQDQRPRRDEL